MPRTPVLIGIAVALLVAAALVWLWPRPPSPPSRPPTADASAPPVIAPAPAPPVAPPAEPANARVTAEDQAPDAAPAALPADDASVRQALVELLGREAVLRLLQTDGFAERVVATVDALPRGHAAPRLWPVHPAEGRFTVDADGQVAAAHDARYAPLVGMVGSLAPGRAAAFYRRLRPQLQAAYENLGYPGRRFEDRLLEVIDHLLATPPAPSPLAVTLTEVRGPIAPERPWVRYEYADPALESRSAGQKILLRVGPAHQRALMAWLRDFRAQIARR